MYKERIRFEHIIKNATRERYIQVAKELGIDDICECDNISTKRRYDSGINGELECTACLYLKYPLSYMYACDNCGEPTLSPLSFLPKELRFYCEDCE